jgi:microcystin degradation protein MlrC
LIRVIREGLKPKKVGVSLPLLVPGEVAVTAMAPANRLYGGLRAYDQVPGMLEANILLGFAWNDRKWTRLTAFAVSEGDQKIAQEQAIKLANEVWAARSEFILRMETAEVAEGLQRAVECSERPVFVSDAGDNTTAGAAGDLTGVLQAVIDTVPKGDVVVAGITAPDLVQRLNRAGVGASIEISLGAEHVSRPRTDRRVTATVEACGQWLDLGGFQPYRSREAAWARVRIGSTIATFHAQPIGITTPEHFEAMGIDPAGHKVYIVKLGYLHPRLEDVSARHILLLSDGSSQLDLSRLQYDQLQRPAWPLDKDFHWSAEDNLFGDLS